MVLDTAALAIEDDHAVDDVPAVDASQGKDSASSLIDDLGHSQAGTARALHNLSLLHGCEQRRSFQVIICGWIGNRRADALRTC